jgi:hypothetical protein
VAHLNDLSTFTPAEQLRLAIYKAMVSVGVYSDTALEPSLAYRFTPHELARLMVYKAAIAAGFYTDQIGEVDREG